MFPTTPVILVLVLTIATCGIAYWADNLGKQLGKKRLSLFGLRPRQTATLISMVTSVIIMLLTLAVLLGFNRSLRNALLNYDRVRKEANQVRKSLITVRLQAQQAKMQLQDTEGQLKTAKRSAESAKTLTYRARKELTTTQHNLTLATAAQAAARKGLAEATRGQRAAKLAERAAIAGQRTAQTKAQEFLSRLNRSASILRLTQAELRANEGQLKKRRIELFRVQQDVKDQKLATGRFISKNWLLTQQSVKLNQQIGDLQKKRQELAALSEEAARSFTEATNIARNYGGLVGLFGAGKIAVPLGKVFAATTVAPASEPARIRTAIRELLDDGAQEAASLGGQPFASDTNPIPRALQLAPRYTGRSGQEAAMSDDEQIEQLSNYLSTFKVPVSIRAMAARNYAEGENKFFARIELVPIKRVFATGETITSSTIDGNATDAQLFNLLLTLVNAGEALARQRDMAPLATKESPDFYAVGTNERIFDALREVQMRARTVRVRLVAAEDATTVDHLRVRFVIEGVGG